MEKQHSSLQGVSPLDIPLPPSPAPTPHIPLLTPDILTLIFSHPPLASLLSLRLVSRSIQQHLNLTFSLWEPHFEQYKPLLPLPYITLPTTLPLYTEDQALLASVLPPPGLAPLEPNRRPFESLRALHFIYKLAHTYLDKLVVLPCGRLPYYTSLITFGPHILSPLITSLTSPPPTTEQPANILTKKYWIKEVLESLRRKKAVEIWKRIDRGEIGMEGMKDGEMRLLGVEAFSAFVVDGVGVGRGEGGGEELTRNGREWMNEAAGKIQRGAESFLEMKREEADGNGERDGEEQEDDGTKIKLGVMVNLLEQGMKAGGYKRSTGPLRLDECFLLSANQNSSHLTHLIDESDFFNNPSGLIVLDSDGQVIQQTSLRDFLEQEDLTETTLSSKEYNYKPSSDIYEQHSSTISPLLYGVVLCGLTDRLGEPVRLVLNPLAGTELLRVVEYDGKLPDEMKTWAYSLRMKKGSGEELEIVSRRRWLGGEFTPYFACEMIHRATFDIIEALHSPSSPSSPSINSSITDKSIDPASALYSVLFARSIVSRPWTDEEAIERCSSNAIELVKHVRKHFPLDVSFVKEAVWDGVDDKTRKVLSVVEEVVRREEGGEILSRRRDGEVVPKYRVGEVVTCDKEDWMGVVVGWEFEFDQKNRDAIEVGPAPDDSEEVDKKQPHYLVLTPGPTNTRHAPNHYIPESLLSVTLRQTPKEFLTLASLDSIGKYFSTWIRVEGKGGPQFERNEEMKARYPDDVWVEFKMLR